MKRRGESKQCRKLKRRKREERRRKESTMSNDVEQPSPRGVVPQTFDEIEEWAMRHAKNEQEVRRIQRTFLVMNRAMVRSRKAIFEAITRNNALNGPMMGNILMRSFGEVSFEPYSNTPQSPITIPSPDNFPEHPPPTPGRDECDRMEDENIYETSKPLKENVFPDYGDVFEDAGQHDTYTDSFTIPRTPGRSLGDFEERSIQETRLVDKANDPTDTSSESLDSSCSKTSSSNSFSSITKHSSKIEIGPALNAPEHQEKTNQIDIEDSVSQPSNASSGKRVKINETEEERDVLLAEPAAQIEERIIQESPRQIMITSNTERQWSVLDSGSTQPITDVASRTSEDVSEISDSDISDAEEEYETITHVQDFSNLIEEARTNQPFVRLIRLKAAFITKSTGGRWQQNGHHGSVTMPFGQNKVIKHRKRVNRVAARSDDLFIPVKILKPGPKPAIEDSSDWELDRKKRQVFNKRTKTVDLGKKFLEMRKRIQTDIKESRNQKSKAASMVNISEAVKDDSKNATNADNQQPGTDSDNSDVEVSSAESEYEEVAVHAPNLQVFRPTCKGSKRSAISKEIISTSESDEFQGDNVVETDSQNSINSSDSISQTEELIRPSKVNVSQKPGVYEAVYSSESEIDPSSAESEYEVLDTVQPSTSRGKPVWYRAGKKVKAPLENVQRNFFKKSTKKIRQVVRKGIKEETFYTKERLRDPEQPAPKQRKKPLYVAPKGTGNFVCNTIVNGVKCGKRFTQKRNLDRHLVSTFLHNPINAKCAYCEVRCTSYRGIEQHTRTHALDHELVKCPFCKRKYKMQQGLYAHLIRKCQMDPNVRRLEPPQNDDAADDD